MAEAEGSHCHGIEKSRPPVLHVVVVGFHHKRGCQVDYAFPPLIAGQPNNSSELPEEWKHLPFLALPDGAHNYKEDSIYFHLPGKGSYKNTIYGVSCYRQIDTKDLKFKHAEYTRGTVQKSVCVLSTLPLYGLIQAKLKLITHAYFGERDFSKTSILEDLYKSLNLSLHSRLLEDSQVFLGLDLRELVLRFKHKILVLFKLLMLERRVLFFCSPAEQLCASVLSIVSLFPGMIEHGLTEAACYRYYKPTTPSLVLEDFGIDTNEYMNIDMSHVPNYRKKKAPSREKQRISQTSQVDVTDTADETLTVDPSRTSQDNLNTNSNRAGHEGDVPIGVQVDNSVDDSDMESDLMTLAARASVNRRSYPKVNSEQASANMEKHIWFNQTDDIITPRQVSGVNRASDAYERTNINKDSLVGKDNVTKRAESMCNNNKRLTRNTESHIVSDHTLTRNTVQSHYNGQRVDSRSACSAKDNARPFSDLDNISAHSSESADINARINAYFDTLAQKHDDLTSLSSCSGSLNSLELSTSQNNTTRTSSRLSEWSMISSDVAVSSRNSLDITADSNDMFPTVKVLEDELLEMIDQELYGPYFQNKRASQPTSQLLSGKPELSSNGQIRNSVDSMQSLPADVLHTPTDSARNSSEVAGHTDEQRFSVADDYVFIPNTPPNTELKTDNFGFPLALFGKGALCHPYISLQQHDLLQDVNVRCFVIGASNMLFKHQRHLVDVLVEIEEGKVIVYDHEVRRQLHLSTADLRFADFLVKNVADEQDDIFLDQTGWEGGDEWIRAQFKVYLLSLMATSAHGNTDQEADFNDSWVRAWKTTHNHRIWKSREFENIDYIHPGHPFTGGLGVNDMKIRLQSAMQTTDRGKKINNALNKTSDAVMHTGKAVGGALFSAKSAVSSWISSFASDEWKEEDIKDEDNKDDDKKVEEIEKKQKNEGNKEDGKVKGKKGVKNGGKIEKKVEDKNKEVKKEEIQGTVISSK